MNHAKEVNLDGSVGEGGGQILRTALTLSLVTGRPFRIAGIRAGRGKPGLLRQHLACVSAASDVSGARVTGAELGSSSLAFSPGDIQPGRYSWRIGSAGSAGLVLQTVALPLLLASGGSELEIAGGTHNGMAPPFEFLELSYLPALRELGFDMQLALGTYGFFPAGGGSIKASINMNGGTASTWPRFEKNAVSVGGIRILALSSGIPDRIGKAEAALAGEALGAPACQRIARMVDSPGPGNVLGTVVEHADGSSVFTSFGAHRLPLEKVVADCVGQVRRYLASGARVEECLQDQLLLPLALRDGGSFTTTLPSAHSLTNMEVIQEFLDVGFDREELGENLWKITVKTGKETNHDAMGNE